MASANDYLGVEENIRADDVFIGRSDRLPTIYPIGGASQNIAIGGKVSMPDLDSIAYSHMVGYNTTTGQLSSQIVSGGGGGGGDVFLGGPNVYGATCVNTYQYQEVHAGAGSSVSFGTDTNVVLKKNIIPTNDAKYVITNGLGELQAGIAKIPIGDVDGLPLDLSTISGVASQNKQDIITINTLTIPPISSVVAANLGKITILQGDYNTLTLTTIPNIDSAILANTTLANNAVSKFNPNTVGATNIWSGDNTWNKLGGNRFINDIEIGTGAPGAGYLHLQDDKIILYCGGGTKGAEIDCDSAEFYGSVSMGFGGQIGKITISNSGQAIGNPVGFEINTDTKYNKGVNIGAVGDAYQTVINTDSTGLLGGKGFLVNSNHAEMNGAIISLGDLSDPSGLIHCYNKLKISTAGLFKDLDPFAPTSSGDPGNRGDITWGLDGGVNYWYVCVGGGGSTNWGRIAMATGW